MRRLLILGTAFALIVTFVTPFMGGGGPGLATATASDSVTGAPILAAGVTAPVAETETHPAAVAMASMVRIDETAMIEQQKAAAAALTTDYEHLAQKPVPKPKPVLSSGGGGGSVAELRQWYAEQGLSCPGDAGGGPGGAPGAYSPLGVAGTTSGDIASFAYTYNAIRVANCMEPVPYGNFFYDSCMEARLFWMAESPSEDPMDAWGHMGSVRIDGVPSPGCDGNLAGGWGNSGATVASKWWDSGAHRASLYRPDYTGGMGGVCIAFAMTHGGVPNEPYDFTRAAARWVWC
jgi:hypothetical protein